jgi:hypothetical protein
VDGAQCDLNCRQSCPRDLPRPAFVPNTPQKNIQK